MAHLQPSHWRITITIEACGHGAVQGCRVNGHVRAKEHGDVDTTADPLLAGALEWIYASDLDYVLTIQFHPGPPPQDREEQAKAIFTRPLYLGVVVLEGPPEYPDRGALLE